jgi:hypothetical protein
MKKIKLTWKGRRAVQRSINHWKRDIVPEIKKKTGSYNDNGGHCPLCSLFYVENYANACDSPACPYIRAYGFSCDSNNPEGHWKKWSRNRCLRTANAMIAALQRILDNEVKE